MEKEVKLKLSIATDKDANFKQSKNANSAPGNYNEHNNGCDNDQTISSNDVVGGFLNHPIAGQYVSPHKNHLETKSELYLNGENPHLSEVGDNLDSFTSQSRGRPVYSAQSDNHHNHHDGSKLRYVTESKNQGDNNPIHERQETKYQVNLSKHQQKTDSHHRKDAKPHQENASKRETHSTERPYANHCPSRKNKSVLIAMDGSGHSFFAFDWYMSQMHTPDTEVIVAHSSMHHVKPFSHVQNLIPSSDHSTLSRLIQQEEEVNKIVAQIKGKLTQSGVRGKLLRLTGEPGAAIIQAAQEHNVQCIVTGSRGLGTVRRTLIGSVSDYILHHSSCPVLVCRHKDS